MGPGGLCLRPGASANCCAPGRRAVRDFRGPRPVPGRSAQEGSWGVGSAPVAGGFGQLLRAGTARGP